MNYRYLNPARIGTAMLGLALLTTPAFAVNKDMVQLQTQVQNLQDAVQHLQQSNDERMGVLKDLMQQNSDTINKMTQIVEGLQKSLTSQQEAASGKVDQVSGQVQALNDSVDEVKARLNGLEKALQNLQSQQQAINAALQNIAPANPNGAPGGAATPEQAGQPGAGTQAGNVPPNSPFAGDNGAARTPPPPSAPPVSQLYQTALKDFMAAKYNLATPEFQDVIKNYPDDTLAGNAYFYLGEIEYRAGHYQESIRNYDKVIEGFPGNQKVPAARLHKGSALLTLKDREAGIAEMRALIQRFPNSPEATQARTKLNGMGVPITPRRPS
jgi:tol-pal system protein YbgF